ncbi:hypothetical protein C8J57DRAFT_1492110 [Mycena rebaudengoi]|nr:hypothetical protein C8J57DRAFT_1492110 [Mycena rebaudengoi]
MTARPPAWSYTPPRTPFSGPPTPTPNAPLFSCSPAPPSPPRVSVDANYNPLTPAARAHFSHRLALLRLEDIGPPPELFHDLCKRMWRVPPRARRPSLGILGTLIHTRQLPGATCTPGSGASVR